MSLLDRISGSGGKEERISRRGRQLMSRERAAGCTHRDVREVFHAAAKEPGLASSSTPV
jgi:hypothetical protein